MKDGFDLVVLKVEGLLGQPQLKLSAKATKEKSFVIGGYYKSVQTKIFREVLGTLGNLIAIEQKGEFADAWDLVIDPNSAPLKPGYSGSPVVDRESGSVIGVVTQCDENTGRHGLAISIRAVRKLWKDVPNLLVEEDIPEKSKKELEGIARTRSKIRKLDEQLKPYVSQSSKEASDWLSSVQNSLARRATDVALERCPNLNQIAKNNTRLAQVLYWEIEKYIENICNSLLTKRLELLEQPPISPFTTEEGELFTLEERILFRDEEGKFYTQVFKYIKAQISKRFSEDIKIEISNYIKILRDNLPK